MPDSLIVSISGMRGLVGRDLTPELVTRHAAALAAWARAHGNAVVVLGRDARTTGPMFARAAAAGIMGAGARVIDLGVVPTPTTQLAVEHHRAGAGLMVSASHNPVQWNALKFIGSDGIFLDPTDGAAVRALAEQGPPWVEWDRVGEYSEDPDAVERHIAQVVALPVLDTDAIRRRRFHVALDCVRGAGGVAIPPLLERLGCRISGIHLEPDGRFPRDPEPVPAHLGELGALVRSTGADIGMAVDPDVDRLALVDETGRPIGEDYTLAFAVRAVLERERADGAPVVVANLSTSLVVEDAAQAGGARLVRAPVGEAHVAHAMLRERALIGGEGNGGVMLPALHLGRDALVGVALVLQYFCSRQTSVSAVVGAAPRYRMVKAKFKRVMDFQDISAALRERFSGAALDTRDGVWLGWKYRWLHVRPSGTEPVIRVIAEGPTQQEVDELMGVCRELLGEELT
jgi:phosphomannomutase